MALYQLLADSDPVMLATLAVRSQQPDADVQSQLEAWPGVFRDDDGRVVGLWGFAIPEMAHRFHADGGRPIYAWCPLDPFLSVPVLRRDALVESRHPITAEAISMTVTPDALTNVFLRM